MLCYYCRWLITICVRCCKSLYIYLKLCSVWIKSRMTQPRWQAMSSACISFIRQQRAIMYVHVFLSELDLSSAAHCSTVWKTHIGTGMQFWYKLFYTVTMANVHLCILSTHKGNRMHITTNMHPLAIYKAQSWTFEWQAIVSIFVHFCQCTVRSNSHLTPVKSNC